MVSNRRTRSCCAPAASGHAAAAPPSRVMKSRRLMGSLTPTITAYHIGIRVCGSEQNWAPIAEVVRSGNSGPAYRRSSLYRHDMLEREVLGANRHEWANGAQLGIRPKTEFFTDD